MSKQLLISKLDEKLSEEEAKDFKELFKGKFQIRGSRIQWMKTHTFLTKAAGDLWKVLSACYIFYTHPLRFLVKNEVKSKTVKDAQADKGGKGKAKAYISVDSNIKDYLPKLDRRDGDTFGEDSRRGSDATWKDVNMSMVARIALLLIELDANFSGSVGFREYWGLSPMMMTESQVKAVIQNDSRHTDKVLATSIAWVQFSRFQIAKKHWGTMGFDKIIATVR